MCMWVYVWFICISLVHIYSQSAWGDKLSTKGNRSKAITIVLLVILCDNTDFLILDNTL